MRVREVSLYNFRNYKELTVNLADGVNILYGANAQGKTNFIESVYYSATGRSHRTSFDKELITHNERQAHIRVFVERNNNINGGIITDRLDVNIKKEGKKGIAVNGTAVKKLIEIFGVLLAVIFSPEDLSLIKAGPSERRRFLDMEICRINPIYYYEIAQYHKILKQRNSLLKDLQKNKEQSLRETIFIWDEQLASHGAKIIRYRQEFTEKINKISSQIHCSISDNAEELTIEYKKNVNPEEFLDKLIKNLDKDIYLGATSAGIHKDDLIMKINGDDAKIFGSQGQQRTACLSLKLSEIELIKQETGVTPVLLLDDVLSELDTTRQKCLLNSIIGVQSIVTCTGADEILNYKDFFSGKSQEINIFYIKNGEITMNN